MLSDQRQDEFFVGYLPLPRRTGRFLRATAAFVIVSLLATAGVLSLAQRDPGDAVWDLSKQTVFEGTLLAKPYPMLRMQGPDGQIVTVLLAGQGKVGAGELVQKLDGSLVRASGHLLMRPVRSMLELDGAPAKVAASAPGLSTVAPERVTLRGEIVDPKCFLGAMKPGDGKTHKACATLCIRGGIPPVLVVADPNGQLTDYLVVVDSIASLLPYVGDRVEVTGDLTVQDDLRVLRVSSQSSGSGRLQIARIAG